MTPQDSGDNAENSYAVVRAIATDDSAALDGFVISGGNADGNDNGIVTGAGMLCDESMAVVRSCVFTGNSAFIAGAGLVQTWGGPARIERCTFSGNRVVNDGAPDFGGSLFAHYSAPGLLIESCSFSGNLGRGGGAAINSACDPLYLNCLFSNNTGVFGGAIRNVAGATPSLVNCTVTENSALAGGGISSDSRSGATIANSIFWTNARVRLRGRRR